MHSLPAVAALVLFGSAIPFVPTGEIVSGSAALTTSDVGPLAALFLISWICSVLGDTVLLLEARLGRRRIQGWLDRRPLGLKVGRAQDKIDRNVSSAVITGRLVPGSRAPVILALGLSRVRLRRFLAADLLACGIWAALYTGIGALGGSIAGNPIWGLVLAIAAAVALSVLLPLGRRLQQRHAGRVRSGHRSTLPVVLEP